MPARPRRWSSLLARVLCGHLPACYRDETLSRREWPFRPRARLSRSRCILASQESTPSNRWTFFQLRLGISFLQTRLLQYTIQSPWGTIVARFPRNCHQSRLRGMSVLAVAPACSSEIPAISLELFNDISDLHQFSNLLRRHNRGLSRRSQAHHAGTQLPKTRPTTIRLLEKRAHVCRVRKFYPRARDAVEVGQVDEPSGEQIQSLTRRPSQAV